LKKKDINSIFSKLVHLISVSLDGCNIDNETMKILLEDSFTENPNRKSMIYLSVSGCESLTSDFLPYLFKHHDLRILKVGRTKNIINPNSLLQIARNLPELQLLDINRCSLVPEKFREISGLSFFLYNTLISSNEQPNSEYDND